MFEMEVAYGKSGPVAGEFLMSLTMCLMFCGEKGVKMWSNG